MTTYFSDGTLVGVTNRNGVYKRTEDAEYFPSRNSIKLDYRDQLGRIARSHKRAISLNSFDGVQQAVVLRESSALNTVNSVLPVVVGAASFVVFIVTLILFLILM
jgi:hypothetical protein